MEKIPKIKIISLGETALSTIEKEIITHENICKINAPIIELSATEIRKMIREKKNVRPMLPPEVFEHIDTKGFYQNSDF